MDYYYLIFFILGIITTIILWNAHKKYIINRDNKRQATIHIQRKEYDGWIKSVNFPTWSNKYKMNKWYDGKEDKIELYHWIKENIKGDFESMYVYGDRYIKFELEEDAIAYKLRWI